MKKKIKLRDLSKKELEQWMNRNCSNTSCKKCKFKYAICTGSNSWFNNKDMFSDKFLDQEIEIEKTNILDEVEKEYFTAIIKPFKKRVLYIQKVTAFDKYFICIAISKYLDSSKIEYINFPLFQNEMYKGMEANRQYTLEDLGL